MIFSTKPVSHPSFRNLIGASSLLAFMAPQIAMAQESTTAVDEIIVTTTRDATSRFDNVGSITTVDAGERANIFPVDLVNRAAGVHINRGSGQEHL